MDRASRIIGDRSTSHRISDFDYDGGIYHLGAINGATERIITAGQTDAC